MRAETTRMPAIVTSIRQITPSIRLLEIVPEGGVEPWEPGSHLHLDVMIGDKQDSRSYSLVGEPDGRAYRIAVKRAPQSRGGSAYVWSLKEGARVTIGPPNNLFPLSYNAAAYLLIAGGIGITPIVGMAQALARHGTNVRMIYTARSKDELAFAGELHAALGDRLSLYITGEGQRIDAARAIADLAPHAELYICGPIGLVDDLRRAWDEAGRAPTSFRTETFGSSGHLAAQPFKLSVPRLGIDIVVPENMSMLDALEQAGVEVMSDCRRGECGLCVLDVVAADSPLDHRDVFLSLHQKDANRKICACVSRAAGGTLLVDPAFREDSI